MDVRSGWRKLCSVVARPRNVEVASWLRSSDREKRLRASSPSEDEMIEGEVQQAGDIANERR